MNAENDKRYIFENLLSELPLITSHFFYLVIVVFVIAFILINLFIDQILIMSFYKIFYIHLRFNSSI